MKLEIEALIDSGTNLPSPPGVAAQIVRLANDENADVDSIAKLLSRDPAITSKVLRIVNSAMYAKPKAIDNLQQAVVIMGLNSTISLALSFSLIDSMQRQSGGGLDYKLYWRRALLAATAAKVIGETVGEMALEELFLAGLLQDIGMLALDRMQPDFYAELNGQQADQDKVVAYELERLEGDHSLVGCHLLRKWCLPERTCLTVEASHNPDLLDRNHELGRFVRCVALSGHVADIFEKDNDDTRFLKLADTAKEYINADRTVLQTIIERVAEIIPEAEALFSTRLVRNGDTAVILEQAREALVIRSLHTQKTVDELKNVTVSLEARTRVLEDMSRRDPLTGLYNRAHLEVVLDQVFDRACSKGTAVSIAFADLDKFKNINDTYGHAAGDQILKSAAQMLRKSLRDSDVVARYGGEEFVIVLPGSPQLVALEVCDRIQRCFRETAHVLNHGWEVPLTISMGIATYGDGITFDSVEEFLQAADTAVYAAKKQGRNRNVVHIQGQGASGPNKLH